MLKVLAYDGDYANPRKLRYEFTVLPREPSESSKLNSQSPLASYFQINPNTGVLSLRKDVQVNQFIARLRCEDSY